MLFIGPGEKVYAGMIIGEHSRANDLDVNPLKAKQLTNIRAAGKDDAVLLTPPTRLTLEQALAYIADDELVEVTPRSIRLRKRAARCRASAASRPSAPRSRSPPGARCAPVAEHGQPVGHRSTSLSRESATGRARCRPSSRPPRRG